MNIIKIAKTILVISLSLALLFFLFFFMIKLTKEIVFNETIICDCKNESLTINVQRIKYALFGNYDTVIINGLNDHNHMKIKFIAHNDYNTELTIFFQNKNRENSIKYYYNHDRTNMKFRTTNGQVLYYNLANGFSVFKDGELCCKVSNPILK